MIKHNFPKSNYDPCSGCGLSWADVVEQMRNETGVLAVFPIQDDDCELRAKKQKLKAFW